MLWWFFVVFRWFYIGGNRPRSTESYAVSNYLQRETAVALPSKRKKQLAKYFWWTYLRWFINYIYMITYNIHQAYIGKYIILHYVNNMVKLVTNFSSCELPGTQWKQFQRTPGRPGTSEPAGQHQNPRVFFTWKDIWDNTKTKGRLASNSHQSCFLLLDHHFCYCLLFSFFWQHLKLGEIALFLFFSPCLNHWPKLPPFFFLPGTKDKKKAHRIWKLRKFRRFSSFVLVFLQKGIPIKGVKLVFRKFNSLQTEFGQIVLHTINVLWIV